MAKKNGEKPREAPEQDLLLDKPRLQLPRSNPVFEVFFYTLLALLGGFGALCCFSTAFHLPVYPAPLLAAGTLCAVLGVMQSLLPRGRAVVFAGGILLWGGAILYFSKEAAEGAGRVLNLILQAYSEKLQFPLRQFAVPEAGQEQGFYTATVFTAMLLPPFFWALAWTLVRRKNGLGAFSLTGAVLSLSMALSILPAFWALCMLLLFWCVLLLSATVLGRRHRLLDEQKRFLVSGAAVRPVLLVLLPITALCMLGVYLLFPQEDYARPRFVNDLRSGMANGFGLEAVLQGGQGANNNRVALDNLRERGYSGKTALRVKYDWENGGAGLREDQQKGYLKSFAGSVYTGHSWEKLAPEDMAALESFAAPGQAQTMEAAFQAYLPVSSYPLEYDYTLSVESVSANPRCIFSPYGLSSDEEDLSSFRAVFEGDGFLRSENLFSGTPAYTLEAVSLPSQHLSYALRLAEHWEEKLIDHKDEAYERAFFADQRNREAYGDTVNREGLLLQLAGGDLDRASQRLFQPLQIKAPDWAKAPLSLEGQGLVDFTEQYSQFVYEKYLQLPDGCRPFLSRFRQSHGLTSPQEAGQDLAEYAYDFFLAQLQQVLAEGYTYTLKPPVMPEGKDFAEFFLSESKTGYCVHFATAAVALCRSAGIPARYAEGYAVPSGHNGTWVDVPDKNAHAWLEVYYSGMGWVPIEVTPVSLEAPATYYNAQAPSAGTVPGEVLEGEELPEISASPSPTPTPAPTASPSAAPSPSAGPGVNSGPAEEEEEPFPSVLALVLGIAGLLALSPAVLWGNRFLHRHWRKKAFSQRDRSKAALALYAHLLRLHALEASLYYGERKPPPHWEETALKARFGREMLSLEELQVLAADAANLEAALKEELSGDRRFYWQYVRGLL